MELDISILACFFPVTCRLEPLEIAVDLEIIPSFGQLSPVDEVVLE